MDDRQTEDLARPFIGMVETILAYYQEAAHEEAFREWYKERYGAEAPEGA